MAEPVPQQIPQPATHEWPQPDHEQSAMNLHGAADQIALFGNLRAVQEVNDLQRLTKAIEGLQTTLGTIQTDMGKVKADVGKMQTDMRDMRAELKADIREVRTELKADIREVRTEMNAMKTELKADIEQVRTEMNAGIASLETKISVVYVLISFGHSELTSISSDHNGRARIHNAAVINEHHDLRPLKTQNDVEPDGFPRSSGQLATYTSMRDFHRLAVDHINKF